MRKMWPFDFVVTKVFGDSAYFSKPQLLKVLFLHINKEARVFPVYICSFHAHDLTRGHLAASHGHSSPWVKHKSFNRLAEEQVWAAFPGLRNFSEYLFKFPWFIPHMVHVVNHSFIFLNSSKERLIMTLLQAHHSLAQTYNLLGTSSVGMNDSALW